MNLHQTLIEKKATLHVAVAGAGVELLGRLWETPGSSAYLTGAVMLQARGELEAFVGFAPDAGYCSKETALDMAFTAYLRAVKAGVAEPDRAHPIGVALTAAVASNRIPRGEQRAHLAIVAPNGVIHRELVFEKREGLQARVEQDRLLADFALTELADALRGETYPTNLDAFERLRKLPLFLPDGRRMRGMPRKGAYFPANFNPIHDGHRHACCEAERRIGAKVHFMIEACPPNKPPIPVPELLRRVAILQLEAAQETERGRAVAITIGEPNYLDKARARPDSRFIAGVDAIERILQPIWGYDVGYMLEEMDQLGTKFYVLGRHIDGHFKTVDDIEIPKAFRHLFEHLDGCHEVSSTQLRQTVETD